MLFAQEHGGEAFARHVLEFDEGAGVRAFAGFDEVEGGQLRGADLFGLDRFEVVHFTDEGADLFEVGGVTVAFLDGPDIVGFDEVQFVGGMKRL